MSRLNLNQIRLGSNIDPTKNFIIKIPDTGADGTLKIERENGTAVLSIGATGKAVIPGVVGTVAQVGGIPTGQVVERGSNANGEYVRFADGTQICWIGSSFTRVAQVTWTFPASFVSTPQLTASVDDSPAPAYYFIAVSVPSPSAATLYRHRRGDLATTTDAFYIRAIAIGRWF